MCFVELVNLSHNYNGQEVLRDLSLSISKGEIFAVIGPTGAGKTTFLRIIGLLEVPSAGEVYIDGKRVPRSGKERLRMRRRMSFIHQKPQVFNLSVYDNIACGLRWRGEDKNRVAEKVDHILEVVGLKEYRNRNAQTLSGGEVQRLALARALVLEPEILLLDEPTANLDPIAATEVEEIIMRIAKQRNTTLLMATHDMSQGQRLADRIGVLFSGKLVQTGNPIEVFHSPCNQDVARLVGTENVLEGVVTANKEGIATLDISGIAIQAVSDSSVGKEVYACIRPEDITLLIADTSQPPAIKSSARNCLRAKVIHIAHLGALSRLELDCGFRLVASITRISAEELNLQMGKEIHAIFKATAVHIIERKSREWQDVLIP